MAAKTAKDKTTAGKNGSLRGPEGGFREKKRRRGRPTIRTAAIEEQIVTWIAKGKGLRAFCEQPGKPGHVTVYHWLREGGVFSERFAHAREVGHDAIAEETLRMADDLPDKVDGKVDQGYVSWLKNRVWTRLQLLSKWNPGRYGDRVAVTGADGAPPIQLSNADAAREVAMLLATAAARKVLAERDSQAKRIEVDLDPDTSE